MFFRTERGDVGVLVNFILITLRICSWDKELMGEGVVVRSFFGEGVRNGGNSLLVNESSVGEVEGEALRP